jgi:AcrR family transcriptional regulator
MEAIELAALGLFWSQGYEKTTAEEIAAASGTSVRTYFRYFPRGKEDVMVLEFRRWVLQLETAIRERPPQESAWTAARAALSSIRLLGGMGGVLSADAIRMHHEVARRNRELHARMTGYQNELVEPLVQMTALRMSVDPNTDVRPRLMIHAIIAAATVAWMAWIADPDADAEADAILIFQQALDVLESGMASALRRVMTVASLPSRPKQDRKKLAAARARR